MNQIYPDEGLVMQLTRIAEGTLRFHLFTNNETPDRDSVLADFTEAAWAGYAAVDLDETDFVTTGTAGHVGYMYADPIAFVNTSGADVDAFGYYVTDTSETVLLAVARFDSAPITKADAESFLVTPVWGDFSQFF